ncbi:MAG: GNAT family N-acetyltransferase [Actinomycetota bacterium]
MPVWIRDAAAADAGAIAAVHVASWRWAYAGILAEDVIDSFSVEGREQMWLEWFDETEDRAALLVAVQDGRVVGFAGVGLSRDVDGEPNTGEVRTLYLLEEVAGLGIGRSLFGEAVARLRSLGYDRAMLWVLRDGARARRFYEAAGWSSDGTTAEYSFGGPSRPIVRYATDL